jgi:hypothetical protein
MKQKIIVIGLIVIVAITLVVFVLIQHTSKPSSDAGTSASTSTAWKTYTDTIGGYSISYPSEYSAWPVDTKDPSFAQPKDHIIISQVGFTTDPNAGHGDFSVSVSSTTYTDPFKWLINQDKIYGSSIGLTSIIEKHITIDGVEAIVTYQKDTVESFPNEKNTVFIKDGKVYEIRTRDGEDGGTFENEERVWQSFKFLNKEK